LPPFLFLNLRDTDVNDINLLASVLKIVIRVKADSYYCLDI